MRRPSTKGNIIRVYAISRHIEQNEIDEVHWNNVDAVPAPCWVTAMVEFLNRAGYPPNSPDISRGSGADYPESEIVDRAQPGPRAHCREFHYHPLAVGKRRQTEHLANSLKRLRRLTEGIFDG